VETSVNCPQCGAPAPFRGTVVSLVCEYCDSTVVRTGVDVKLVGKVSALTDTGSPILLDSKGRLDAIPFHVSGRLQVQYARGTWNEWFLEFADGTTGWLADAQGSFAIVRPRDAATVADDLPPFREITVGQLIPLDGVPAVVTDVRAASYKGAEGVLPFEAEPGILFHGVDLRGPKGEFHTLDYGTTPGGTPTPYIGASVTLKEIELHPLRRFEGWRPHRLEPPGAST
jgi:hypothetical protein